MNPSRWPEFRAEIATGGSLSSDCHDNRADIVAPGSPLSTCFRLAAAYDRLRLSLYRERGLRGHLISTLSTDSATLLRFDDVGYFNRVYAHDVEISERLELVERFFRGSPHASRLLFPTSSVRLARACIRRGWVPDEEYAWLAGAVVVRPTESVRGFEIRAPRRDEHEIFVRTYLEGFGAAPGVVSAAIENMRHLFSHPDLYFRIAFVDGRPAGIGMMYRVGRAALLCAGVTLPACRLHGCHTALLSARIHLAHEFGCDRVYSWAAAGGRSHGNMSKAGLRTAGTSLVWRFRPSRIS